MAWVSYERTNDGTSLSGEIGQPMVDTLAWEITTDGEGDSKATILAGVTGTMGITWGSSHPDLPALKAVAFKLAKIDKKKWRLDVTFTVPKRPLKENGIPEDVLEEAGMTVIEPAIRDVSGDDILNAAGDPVEGLERERDEETLILTKYFEDEASLQAAKVAYAGRTNGDTWKGYGPHKWKCYYKGAKKVGISKLDGSEDAGTLYFIESRWEFRLNRDGWIAKPWDLGFMELSGSGYRKTIMGDDKKPVKQPVALNTDGTAKTPGEPPGVIRDGDGAQLYLTATMADGFGTPVLLES
jgi:hypothetical protein